MIVPYRGDEMDVRHIKVMADLGNVAPIPFCVRDRESVRNAVSGSDVVINLIGKHYETKHFVPWAGSQTVLVEETIVNRIQIA